MKITVISNEPGVGRNFVYLNLVEVLAESKSMECVNFENNEIAVNEADYIVLVSSCTRDSLAALKDLISSVESKGKAYGVLMNKVKSENNEIKAYCMTNQIKILEEIPFDEVISKSTDEGLVISIENEVYRMKFLNVLNNIYIHMANMIFKIKAEGSDGCES